MKRYPHIISQLFYQPLLITRAKHQAICQILEARLAQEASGQPQAMRDDDDEPEEKTDEQIYGYRQVGNTAIIPVHGILGKHLDFMDMISGGCDVDRVAAMAEVADSDRNVKEVIFDFQTPGGSVTGIPELGRQIAGMRKKTVAFTDSECCSGGMWLAEQCHNFFCTESSRTGSIGVWCAYFDYTKALKIEGIKVQSISAGKYKLMGAYWKPLTDEETKRLQDGVDKIYAQFKEAVCLRREVQDEFMQGQIFDGPEAVEAGLVDGLVESMAELVD